jgi:DNA-binding PadR family transcriptional regulator
VSSIVPTPVSYLVLGLVARLGAATPYDLKQSAGRSIGNFWSFPHSQLYAEPERLAEAGLLEEEREPHGRRRRTYTITEAGRRALREWLREPVEQRAQIRDLALLKLFFGDFAQPDDVVALAQAQSTEHRARLEEFAAIDERLRAVEDAAYPQATLRLGLRIERALAEFWQEIAERPPRRTRRSQRATQRV